MISVAKKISHAWDVGWQFSNLSHEYHLGPCTNVQIYTFQNNYFLCLKSFVNAKNINATT